jgi:hypothetical protein
VWPVAVPLIVLVVCAAGWSMLWFSAANRAERLVGDWFDREAQVNRIYECGKRKVEGFPFQIVLRCEDASATLNNLKPSLGLDVGDVQVTGYLYQPTLLNAEFAGPLSIGERGQTQRIVAGWERARATVSGVPRSPERFSFSLDKPLFERVTDNGRERLLAGEHIDLTARLSYSPASGRPWLDISGKAVATSAPGIYSIASDPSDGDFEIRFHGLKDFAPKPWPERFREIQQAGGRIEVRSFHLGQSDWLATGSGSIGLTSSGMLNGEMIVIVAGLDKLMKQLGVEYAAHDERVNSAIGVLNQLVPGLGDIARQHAPAAAGAGLALLGVSTELGGRKATRLPLRFTDGLVSLGPIPIGQTAALF